MQVETANFDSVIIRFSGEIWIKSDWTKRAYERQLRKNIKNTLDHNEIQFEKIERKQGRLYVRTEKANEAATALVKVFGLSSVSPAVKTTAQTTDIIREGLALAHLMLKKGDSFAVRCTREGKHPYSSSDINRIVGQQILERLSEKKLKVNLSQPNATVGVEIRDESAFLFSGEIKAVGGMPLGTQPKVVCLQSGGIDSPVACWMAMKRGCPIVQIYFDNRPFTDQSTTERALTIAKVLYDYAVGFQRKMYSVPHGENLNEIVEKCPRRLTCLLCKRTMYRVAEKIADLENAEGIVTGEAIGEQASQTLRNLRVLNSTIVRYPIHRPLLGFDKIETEALAKKIGTYTASIIKAEECTAAPDKPSTQAKLKDIEDAEKALDIDGMVQSALKASKVLFL